jgi:two-component system, cell cycle response regulator CpdR
MAEKILVAEDNNLMRKTICEFLQRFDYAVIEASDGAEAIELLNEHHFDLIISDLAMPNNGVKLVDHVLSSFPHTPMIILTGYVSSPSGKPLPNTVDVLVKPVSLQHLLSTVQRRLRPRP